MEALGTTLPQAELQAYYNDFMRIKLLRCAEEYVFTLFTQSTHWTLGSSLLGFGVGVWTGYMTGRNVLKKRVLRIVHQIDNQGTLAKQYSESVKTTNLAAMLATNVFEYGLTTQIPRLSYLSSIAFGALEGYSTGVAFGQIAGCKAADYFGRAPMTNSPVHYV